MGVREKIRVTKVLWDPVCPRGGLNSRGWMSMATRSVRQKHCVTVREVDTEAIVSTSVAPTADHGVSLPTRLCGRGRMVGVSNTADEGRTSLPIQIPEDIFERVGTLCLALPEVTVRVDASLVRSRSTAYSFDIRRRSFCLLVASEVRTGRPAPLLVLRADPDERDALLAVGHPFFPSGAGRDRVGVWLTDDTDWEEIRELLTESYRRIAPKKLTALVDEPHRQ
jgi:YjbR